MYQKVQKTPFIPFFLPDGSKMTMMDILNTLRGTSQKPLVIFIVHHPIDIPDPQQYPLEFKTIRIPKAHIPDGPAFYEFKNYVYEFLKYNPYGLIGICTNQRADLCGYFVVRWLIEEKNTSIEEAISLYLRLNSCHLILYFLIEFIISLLFSKFSFIRDSFIWDLY